VACFITPLAAGAAVALARRAAKRSDRLKLWALELMLLGGALVLAVEHAWHGEVVPYPPFLTAMKNPSDVPVMLHEMWAVGGSMTAAVASVWASIVALSRALAQRLSIGAQRISTALEPSALSERS